MSCDLCLILFYTFESKDDYNRKLGLGKRRNSDNPRGKRRFSDDDETTVRRRKGYAYRYKPEEDDEYGSEYAGEEIGGNGARGFNEESNKGNINFDVGGDQLSDTVGNESKATDPNIIDVKATVQNESPEPTKDIKDGRNMKQQSWEERAQAYEQVPPSNIKAWGPQGVIDGGIDIRSFVARNALEEISEARKVFEKKEEMVNMAENDLIQLKR